MKRLLFLASGRGSCFQSICEAVERGELKAKIVGLICNQPAAALEIARKFHVPEVLIPHRDFRGPQGKWDRKAYEKELSSKINSFNPDWICLAGYMLRLEPETVAHWEGRIVNIHPSLLPAFPGLNAQRQALEHGVRWTGCTVHLVTAELDAGPILEQSPIEIQRTDTEQTLIQRLLPLEHQTYLRALKRLCEQDQPAKK